MLGPSTTVQPLLSIPSNWELYRSQCHPQEAEWGREPWYTTLRNGNLDPYYERYYPPFQNRSCHTSKDELNETGLVRGVHGNPFGNRNKEKARQGAADKLAQEQQAGAEQEKQRQFYDQYYSSTAQTSQIPQLQSTAAAPAQPTAWSSYQRSYGQASQSVQQQNTAVVPSRSTTWSPYQRSDNQATQSAQQQNAAAARSRSRSRSRLPAWSSAQRSDSQTRHSNPQHDTAAAPSQATEYSSWIWSIEYMLRATIQTRPHLMSLGKLEYHWAPKTKPEATSATQTSTKGAPAPESAPTSSGLSLGVDTTSPTDGGTHISSTAQQKGAGAGANVETQESSTGYGIARSFGWEIKANCTNIDH
ncbi:hypothetical protein EK21DRAFT_94718 [Setomelanomma holmii]|uniref:Uncharacterized protein n=1 Tax=Setomelanomma holmii TaxID=210430 RepID=A0A9P4GVV6_9PLEO|nr:hypothetical protein EK21DRAFT_94718 [Setomelanomma holmii]